jgi:hypothetical protein
MKDSRTKAALHLPNSFVFYSQVIDLSIQLDYWLIQVKSVQHYLYLEFLDSAAYLFPKLLDARILSFLIIIISS